MATQPRRKNGDVRGTSPRRATLVLLSGRIVGVTDDGAALFVSDDGAPVRCRCPQHVRVGWLRAAVERGAVDAEIAADETLESGSVWAVFPGVAHVDVAEDTVELRAGRRLRVTCGDASVTLTRDGKARVRGRDVSIRGSRIARVVGGVVKIN